MLGGRREEANQAMRDQFMRKALGEQKAKAYTADNLGATLPRIELSSFTGQVGGRLDLPITQLTAPQYYKGDYDSFPVGAREVQVVASGNMFFPCCGRDRVPDREDIRTQNALRNGCLVRGIICDPLEIRDQVAAQYWSAKGRAGIDQTTGALFANRLASRLGGVSLDEFGGFVTQGKLFEDMHGSDKKRSR